MFDGGLTLRDGSSTQLKQKKNMFDGLLTKKYSLLGKRELRRERKRGSFGEERSTSPVGVRSKYAAAFDEGEEGERVTELGLLLQMKMHKKMVMG
jgi:hypothetical protein